MSQTTIALAEFSTISVVELLAALYFGGFFG